MNPYIIFLNCKAIALEARIEKALINKATCAYLFNASLIHILRKELINEPIDYNILDNSDSTPAVKVKNYFLTVISKFEKKELNCDKFIYNVNKVCLALDNYHNSNRDKGLLFHKTALLNPEPLPYLDAVKCMAKSTKLPDALIMSMMEQTRKIDIVYKALDNKTSYYIRNDRVKGHYRKLKTFNNLARLPNGFISNSELGSLYSTIVSIIQRFGVEPITLFGYELIKEAKADGFYVYTFKYKNIHFQCIKTTKRMDTYVEHTN